VILLALLSFPLLGKELLSESLLENTCPGNRAFSALSTF
jgi:hypothetical protein